MKTSPSIRSVVKFNRFKRLLQMIVVAFVVDLAKTNEKLRSKISHMLCEVCSRSEQPQKGVKWARKVCEQFIRNIVFKLVRKILHNIFKTNKRMYTNYFLFFNTKTIIRW